MAMGQQKDRQGDLMVSWSEMPRSPGHVFYDRLQSVLVEADFDGFAEALCKPYYAARMGAPSVPPGRYFRMHLVGYFEGIGSERGLSWRCSDSLSLRDFLRLESRDRVPDHSWLSKTRSRLPHEVHQAIFDWVLAQIAEAGLVKGERIGVDASTMEANAALRNIVRRDTAEGYREMLERLAQESGIETPTAADLVRLDRKRKGKKLSNQDWVSKSDPEAKIAKMKDGTTHLAYKPEHAVDLDTGAVVAAELHPADEGDTTTLFKTLAAAEANLEAVDAAPTAENPAACVADKGYHSRAVLKALDDSLWKTRIAEPKQKGFSRWHGDEAAQRAVTNNRVRLKSGVAREAFKRRAEIVERSFAHNLDRGGMRRTWLRGRENVHKRYLLHVAGHNLSLLMRQLIGAGTPREAVAGGYGCIFVIIAPAGTILVAQILLIVSQEGKTAFAAIWIAVE
ncbi:MAG: transposase [Erythrobacter sp.]|nr:transposase [Erythrobacter sp.]